MTITEALIVYTSGDFESLPEVRLIRKPDGGIAWVEVPDADVTRLIFPEAVRSISGVRDHD